VPENSYQTLGNWFNGEPSVAPSALNSNVQYFSRNNDLKLMNVPSLMNQTYDTPTGVDSASTTQNMFVKQVSTPDHIQIPFARAGGGRRKATPRRTRRQKQQRGGGFGGSTADAKDHALCTQAYNKPNVKKSAKACANMPDVLGLNKKEFCCKMFTQTDEAGPLKMCGARNECADKPKI
jgi:hypothetical protein